MIDETKVTSEQAHDTDEESIATTEEEILEEVEVVEDEADITESESDESNQKIAELEAKLAESESRYLRLYADFENFRRRSQLDREAGEKYRAQNLVTNLLPAIDNFERAMQVDLDNEQAKSLLTGVEMVYRGIIDALKQEGAEQIEAVGEEFDPNLHQAVMQTEEEQYGPNIVVEEFQKGYKLKDRVIRPSMVKVNK
ncbi:nucleotide exchange factor GrpE [Lederbergia lenta]|uniref:Protein GrpE n=1 Tax=Lederbergia lenta TaxID=1467 RepID=A0A2X4VZP3_LEDLE|nr:nucleotide exchange factor GrpE [Lederbergia lenta]MCM3111365.1 nucleotide exchange factor GrpE [Lederbergia lenta]MEC2325248.1 nucleotide exchange factor GrpE [Lederbergia lenta]SQI55889.1 heat shock protein GrpE [Lederbergia lenta]